MIEPLDLMDGVAVRTLRTSSIFAIHLSDRVWFNNKWQISIYRLINWKFLTSFVCLACICVFVQKVTWLSLFPKLLHRPGVLSAFLDRCNFKVSDFSLLREFWLFPNRKFLTSRVRWLRTCLSTFLVWKKSMNMFQNLHHAARCARCCAVVIL